MGLDFIYTKNAARRRLNYIYTKNLVGKIMEKQWFIQNIFRAARGNLLRTILYTSMLYEMRDGGGLHENGRFP